MNSKPDRSNRRLHTPGAISIALCLLIASLTQAKSESRIFDQNHHMLKVIDGDTVQIGAITYDLYGIDAPELGQICFNGNSPWHCGLDAVYALHKRFAFDPPDCRPVKNPKTTGKNRQEAICITGGIPAALVLVKDGYAITLPAAPANYQRAESQAKHESIGVWRGSYVPPKDWRDGMRLDGEAGHAPKCPVKAITTVKGGKLYFVPLDAEFRSIKVRKTRGDRCFGSDGTARDAGYKRSPPFQP